MTARTRFLRAYCFWLSTYVALVLCASLWIVSCAPTPPQLSPSAATAYQARRVVAVLDVIRDTTVDAEKQGLLSTDNARKIVTWHKAALLTIQEAPTGWRSTVRASLDQVFQQLPSKEQQVVAAYFALAKALLQEGF